MPVLATSPTCSRDFATPPTERLIELACEELGPPPVAFSFIAMGSQGRGELTLAADQDNGIIYAHADGADPDTIRDFFLRLGERVNEGLAIAGYPYCRGTPRLGTRAVPIAAGLALDRG